MFNNIKNYNKKKKPDKQTACQSVELEVLMDNQSGISISHIKNKYFIRPYGKEDTSLQDGELKDMKARWAEQNILDWMNCDINLTT